MTTRIDPSTTWSQFAKPLPGSCIEVTHFHVSGAVESEHALDSAICISHIRKAAKRSEMLRDGRWIDSGMRSGTISLVASDQHEHVRWDGALESVNIWVSLDAFRGEDDEQPRDFPSLPEHLYGIRDRLLTEVVEAIYQDNQEGAPFGLSYSEALVMSAMHRMKVLSSGAQLLPKRNKDDLKAVQKAVDYIHAHLDRSLLLHDVASGTGYTRSLYALTRQFKSQLGRSPHQFILETRLARAKELLMTGTGSVTDVATACGFPNLSHFSDAFKARWGASPSAFRKTNGQG